MARLDFFGVRDDLLAVRQDSGAKRRASMTLYRGAWAGFLILASAVSGCAGTARADSITTAEQDRVSIDKTRKESMAAWEQGRADRVAALYASDAMVLYPKVILARQADGSWKVARDMDNSTEPWTFSPSRDRTLRGVSATSSWLL